MSRFGETAVRATEIYRAGQVDSPRDAWKSAAQEIFPESKSSQEKSCPRDAYLGLCEEGFVRDVPPGEYTQSKLNKGYAVSAVAALINNPDPPQDANTLWKEVLQGDEKTPNGQMDVVVALWKNCDIIPPT